MRAKLVLCTLSALALTGHFTLPGAFAQTAVLTDAQAQALAAAAGTTAPSLEVGEAARRDALLRASVSLDDGERTDIMAFYAARGHQPFWSGSGREDVLVAAIENAGAHGLPVSRYQPAALREAFSATGPDATAASEITAMQTYLRFARDLNSGALTPSRVDDEIALRPARPGRADLMARAASAPLPEVLAGLEPAHPDYRILLAEKTRLEATARATDWGAPVPSGGTLRLGDSGPRVAALRARLTARGYGPTDGAVVAVAPGQEAPAASAGFDAPLDVALKKFQSDQGLEADGLAGAQTLSALNERPNVVLEQVIVNLERLRWMNRELGSRYIYVNIPDFSVQVVEGDTAVFTSRVVVGKTPDTRTPEFSDEMTYFVVNPTWHIPDSIAQRVYLPKLKNDPQTLAKSNMRIFTRSGTEINPGLVDFRQFDQGNFPFRIKQNPSDANALGMVKFMFPNEYAIYLHDTPHREYFAKDVRAFSNGCIRVEKPSELAYLLLDGQVTDPVATFEGWVASRTERTVTLQRPIPVHIVYRTIFVDESGGVQRRLDVYGRDAAVFAALKAAGVTLPAAQG